ncbi:MAG TPA: prepilin-type N-terminal cleavage/methylation domain-containing protein [Armatimonadota bacterium]|jgi:prepilin-type N-terminal cleavage/methylation domain-containing protein
MSEALRRARSKSGLPGFTILELMVTIAILTVVMSLLAFPIMAAYGYIQKAQARTDAQNAGDATVQRLKKELDTAAYVFDLPPDGSAISFIPGIEDGANNGAVLDANGQVTFVRYMQVLDNPWKPYLPFWQTSLLNTTNAYILGRYQSPASLAFARAQFYATTQCPIAMPADIQQVNGSLVTVNSVAPFDVGTSVILHDAGTGDLQRTQVATVDPVARTLTFTDTLSSAFANGGTVDRAWYTLVANDPTTNLNTLDALFRRKYRNELIAVSPLGPRWDLVHFQVTPLRQVSESLTLQPDAYGNKQATVAVARYPLWATRNLDLDNLHADDLFADPVLFKLYGLGDYDTMTQAERDAAKSALLAKLKAALFQLHGLGDYASMSATARGDATRKLSDLLNCAYPMYGIPRQGQLHNPFGYQIRVFNQSGALIFGTKNDKDEPLTLQCHFMDWPPIDRQDFNWDAPQSFLWTKEDIDRQRLEGKLVFAQPLRADQLNLTTDGTNATGTLPCPTGWDDLRTYLVNFPRTVTLKNGTTTTTFHRVMAETELKPGTFFLPNIGKYDDTSRTIKFGEALSAGNWQFVTASGSASPVRYTICDLLPTDLVVGTYSTKAVLDVSLTLSRRDSAGRSPMLTRQDYSANFHIVAQNAMKHARGSR